MHEAWMHGAYVHVAVRSALSQVVPAAVNRGLGSMKADTYKQMLEKYPSKPYEKEEEIIDEVEKEEKYRQDMLDWV